MSAAAASFDGILSQGGVVKVDDSTVEFHLDAPNADFPYLVASTNYDCLILPSTYKMGTWQKTPVGTGPYMLTDYTAKQSATFKKNPKYWQSGLPYLDGVRSHFNEQTQAQGLALQAGSVDMMLYTPVQGSQALFTDPNVKVIATPSTMHRELAMRVDTAPFTDKRVRQALAYTLDRPALIQALFNGKAEVADDNIFFKQYPLSPQDLPPRTQDIAKAKALLTAAGMPNGVNATLFVEEYEEIQQYATLLQAMAKPAGINLKLNQVTVTYWYGSGANQPWLQAPMGITDWTFRGVPDQYFAAFTTNGVWNSSKFSDPAFDAAVKGYLTTVDETQRRAYARTGATILMDATPAIIPYTISVNRAMRPERPGRDFRSGRVPRPDQGVSGIDDRATARVW